MGGAKHGLAADQWDAKGDRKGGGATLSGGDRAAVGGGVGEWSTGSEPGSSGRAIAPTDYALLRPHGSDGRSLTGGLAGARRTGDGGGSHSSGRSGGLGTTGDRLAEFVNSDNSRNSDRLMARRVDRRSCDRLG
jgi:hypothetical protein